MGPHERLLIYLAGFRRGRMAGLVHGYLVACLVLVVAVFVSMVW